MDGSSLVVNNEFYEVLNTAIVVNSANSLEEIVHSVIQRVDGLLSYDRASIALIDAAGTYLEVREISVHNSESSVSDVGKHIPIREDNALGWAVLHGKPHVKQSAADTTEFQRLQSDREPLSHVIVPIIGREKILGVLGIGAFREHAFGDSEITLLQHYARLVGIAIENLQNFELTREQSIRDGLTGCFNHRHFNDVLKREISRTVRHGDPLSLIILDVDHFKRFNDEFGHQAGDQVLIQTVSLIERVTRPSDILFRYGGEEFCLLLAATDSGGAVQAADKLLGEIREHNNYRPDRTRSIQVLMSIGIATAPDHATSADALIACADQALYFAKNNGRDRAVLYDDSPAASEVTCALDSDQSASGAQLSRAKALPLDDHSLRVAQFAQLASEKADLTEEQRTNLQIAAFFHDLGESTIPDSVMRKPGKLDHYERKLIETHPVVGAGILERATETRDIIEAVLYHHERYDGSGYPKGLKGKSIPILARILAIAEVFDALVTERPYRLPVSTAAAYATLRQAAGYQLDPNLVEDFIASHMAHASLQRRKINK